uniref:Uncharacterized protein n=1 Tax=Zonotrichia albicollis TaxID=44394 RepID=A0A8D2N9F9_ZONAL
MAGFWFGHCSFECCLLKKTDSLGTEPTALAPTAPVQHCSCFLGDLCQATSLASEQETREDSVCLFPVS